MPVGARDDARVQHGRFPGVGKGLKRSVLQVALEPSLFWCTLTVCSPYGTRPQHKERESTAFHCVATHRPGTLILNANTEYFNLV